MKNKKTADLLDRIRDVSRRVYLSQSTLAQALQTNEYHRPDGPIQRGQIQVQLRNFTEATAELHGLLEAASIIGIPPADLMVTTGPDVTKFWDLFDDYRAGGAS